MVYKFNYYLVFTMFLLPLKKKFGSDQLTAVNRKIFLSKPKPNRVPEKKICSVNRTKNFIKFDPIFRFDFLNFLIQFSILIFLLTPTKHKRVKFDT